MWAFIVMIFTVFGKNFPFFGVALLCVVRPLSQCYFISFHFIWFVSFSLLFVCLSGFAARLAEVVVVAKRRLCSIFLNQFLCVSTRLLLMDGLKASGLFLYYFLVCVFCFWDAYSFLHLKNAHNFGVKRCLKLVWLLGSSNSGEGAELSSHSEHQRRKQSRNG